MIVQMFCIHCYHHHQVTISFGDIGDYNQPNVARCIPHIDPRECISNLKSRINEIVMSVNNLQNQMATVTNYLLNQQHDHLPMFSNLGLASLEAPYGLELNHPS